MKETIKKWIIFWITAWITMLIIWASYATWTSIPTETDWQPLTSAKWNTVIDRLNSIDEQQLATAWVNFDGINCPSNLCNIRASYNIDRVEKDLVDVWTYYVYFQTPMTSEYSISLAFENIVSWVRWHHNEMTTTYVKIRSMKPTTDSLGDTNTVSMQVFWWKIY